MNSKPNAEHTLFPLTTKELLPPLQKRIFLFLSENEPQTINETVKALKGHYKSSWLAFNALEKKAMIKKVTLKLYRGREYPCFWITEGGVFVALCEGANPNKLLEKVQKIYPENKVLQCLLEISPILGIDGFKVVYLAVLAKGKVEESDLATLMATQMQSKITIEDASKLVEIVKKYPEEHERFIENSRHIEENMKKISSLLEEKSS
jgi:hypothetical protein